MAEQTFLDALADAAFGARDGSDREIGDAVLNAARQWLTSDHAANALAQRLLDNFALAYTIPSEVSLDARSTAYAGTRQSAREALQEVADAIEKGVQS